MNGRENEYMFPTSTTASSVAPKLVQTWKSPGEQQIAGPTPEVCDEVGSHLRQVLRGAPRNLNV